MEDNHPIVVYERKIKQRILRATCLVLPPVIALVCLLLIFHESPVRLNPDVFSIQSDGGQVVRFSGLSEKLVQDSSDGLKDFLLAEHEKVVQEIQQNIDANDRWFHIKFLLIGTLMWAFLTAVRKKALSSPKGREKFLKEIVSSPISATVLAMSCVIALSVDIHVRIKQSTISQAGTWIAEYLEPAFLDPHLKDQRNFVGWENFLRVGQRRTCTTLHEEKTFRGMHADSVFQFIATTTHLYVVSIVLYILYLLVSRAAWRTSREMNTRSSTTTILLAGAVFVHALVLFFATVAHSAPSTFQINIWPNPLFRECLTTWGKSCGCWQEPRYAEISTVGIGAVLIVVYCFYVYLRCMKWKKNDRRSITYRVFG